MRIVEIAELKNANDKNILSSIWIWKNAK